MFRSMIHALASEQSDTQTATLSSAGIATLPTVTPKRAGGLSIVGIIMTITANMTQSAAANWTVGSLIKEMVIKKGANKQIDINGEDQLEKVFHLLTGLPIGATFNTGAPTYFSNPTSAGAAGASAETETVFLPVHFRTDVVPQITLTVNGYSTITNGTGGTVSFQVEYLYSNMPVSDDLIKIVTAPSALNSATDINVAQYFSEAKPVNEVWIEVPSDAALSYQSYEVGQTTVYKAETATSLSFQEDILPTYSHISGFFKSRMKPNTVFPTTGSNANSPQLILNLATSQTPTFYLVLASQ